MSIVSDPVLVGLVEAGARARCRHSVDPCQACTNLALWAVEVFVSSGWYAQQQRHSQAITRSASISAPIPIQSPTSRPTPRNAA